MPQERVPPSPMLAAGRFGCALMHRIGMVVALLALLALPSRVSARAAAPCGPNWTVVPTPTTGLPFERLNGVDAISADDVWAVGAADDQLLTMHWDGASWSIVRSPRLVGELDAVDASSADDVWAVGSTRRFALIVHWDGRTWTVASRSVPGSLAGVVALPSGWALAVGTQQGVHEFRPLAMQLRGSSWEQVHAVSRGFPDPQSFNAVDATSRTDAWAVGTADLNFGGPTANLAQRWNGAEFSTFKIPTPHEGFDSLLGIDAFGPDEAWAVGTASQPTFETTGITVSEHWDGSRWRQVTPPNRTFRRFDEFDDRLLGVTEVAPDEVWAVGFAFGYSLERGMGTGVRMMAMRWNGEKWEIVPTPDAGAVRKSALHAVDSLPDGHVWAVGDSFDQHVVRPLVIERC